MHTENQTGDRIKNIRESLSLSQVEFANRLGISQSTISCYEKNQRTPPEALIRLIAGIYNVNIKYLLDNEEPMFMDIDQAFKLPLDKMQIFENFCQAYELDDNSQKILKDIIALPDNNKHIVQEFLKFIKNINKHN